MLSLVLEVLSFIYNKYKYTQNILTNTTDFCVQVHASGCREYILRTLYMISKRVDRLPRILCDIQWKENAGKKIIRAAMAIAMDFRHCNPAVNQIQTLRACLFTSIVDSGVCNT